MSAADSISTMSKCWMLVACSRFTVRALQAEPRAFGYGMAVFFGSLASAINLFIERRKLLADLSAMEMRVDMLFTDWCSVGGQAETFWRLRDVCARQRQSDRESSDTDQWRHGSALIDHEKRNLLLNSQYYMLCESRLVGHWSQDDWSSELPEVTCAVSSPNAP